MKVRFKRSQKFDDMLIEIENDEGKSIEFPLSELDNFIHNREINQVIFSDEMTKEQKVNLKLMIEKLIEKIAL